MIVVDAHEDIAHNMVNYGRDYVRSVSETRELEAGSETVIRNGHTLLGWPEWIEGRVAVIFATLFSKPIRWKKGEWEHNVYSDDIEANYNYRRQLDTYHRLFDEHGDKFVGIASVDDLEETLETWEDDPLQDPLIGFVLLMEGGEGVSEPGELEMWFEGGVRILGPAWSGTRFCGGTREPGPLTKFGYELLDAMAEWGMILDLSHMAEKAALQSFDRYPGSIIASHSNVRSLLNGSDIPDRHLSDLTIMRMAERDGVIGIVPFNKFLLGGWDDGDPREWVTMDHVAAQIDHICQRVGSASHAAIGSDFDGGFGLDKVPVELDSVADLKLIGDALKKQGYGREDVEAILGGNWLRVLRTALPKR
ncbi:MAG: peptidase M19 [Anaerolineales bacterium]|nr:peptidase M19 [Anaerolineales bacterium]